MSESRQAPGGEQGPAILAEGLRKYYGNVKALDGVDLSVGAGTVKALLGPNGSGKTTFIRIVTTLLRPDGGRAFVRGYDVERHPDEVRRIIGLAGQYPAVDENLTGRENLEMVGRLYHLGRDFARRRARELLDEFGLANAAQQRAKTYSGGMRRRLDLAASIVARPPVLFLDEPTSGLDPRSRIGMWDRITSLVREGTTVFLTTQYLDEADRLAHSIAVIDQGKIIAEGSSDELKSCCGGDSMLDLRVTPERTGDAGQLLAALGNGKLQANESTGHITMPAKDGSSTVLEAVRRLDRGGIEITDLSLRRPTLDDVFLSLTGHSAEEGEGTLEPTTSRDGGKQRQ